MRPWMSCSSGKARRRTTCWWVASRTWRWNLESKDVGVDGQGRTANSTAAESSPAKKTAREMGSAGPQSFSGIRQVLLALLPALLRSLSRLRLLCLSLLRFGFFPRLLLRLGLFLRLRAGASTSRRWRYGRGRWLFHDELFLFFLNDLFHFAGGFLLFKPEILCFVVAVFRIHGMHWNLPSNGAPGQPE